MKKNQNTEYKPLLAARPQIPCSYFSYCAWIVRLPIKEGTVCHGKVQCRACQLRMLLSHSHLQYRSWNDVLSLMNQHFFSNKSSTDLLLFACWEEHVILLSHFLSTLQRHWKEFVCTFWCFSFVGFQDPRVEGSIVESTLIRCCMCSRFLCRDNALIEL